MKNLSLILLLIIELFVTSCSKETTYSPIKFIDDNDWYKGDFGIVKQNIHLDNKLQPIEALISDDEDIYFDFVPLCIDPNYQLIIDNWD